MAMMKNEIVKKLNEKGLQAVWKTVNNNGVLHTGIVIRTEGNVAPVIYTDELLNECDSVEMAIGRILRKYEKAKNVNFDISRITGREYILENITVAVQKNGTEKLVKRASGFEGIEAYLAVMNIGMKAEGNLLMKVTADLLEMSHISEEEAWERAERNLHESIEITGFSVNGNQIMHIISNKWGILGASSVLDREVMRAFARKHHTKKIAILPSSINEMILLPDGDAFPEEYLTDLVREINETEVAPEERLTDRAYLMEF